MVWDLRAWLRMLTPQYACQQVLSDIYLSFDKKFFRLQAMGEHQRLNRGAMNALVSDRTDS